MKNKANAENTNTLNIYSPFFKSLNNLSILFKIGLKFKLFYQSCLQKCEIYIFSYTFLSQKEQQSLFLSYNKNRI
ncbi:hypothetical protein CQA38_03795 [Campylobacter sp. MIT 12-5580]|nr:hypothetical protein CQA38_03795 [Campylobacter sp. MIT 12-5580]